MTSKNDMHVDQAPKPVGLYPHAKKVGSLLFLSGLGPRRPGDGVIPGLIQDPKTGEILAYDFEAQVEQVFANIKTVLEASGSSWEKLVDVTVFLTNMKNDFHAFNRMYAEAFSGNQPTRTTVEVNCLPTPIAIELKCIATLQYDFNPTCNVPVGFSVRSIYMSNSELS